MICFTLILKHIKQVEADMEEVDVRYFLKRWFDCPQCLNVFLPFCQALWYHTVTLAVAQKVTLHARV